MARSSKLIKPENAETIVVHVVRSERISPNFVRVTLGGEQLRQFVPLGFDQWFRMFLPAEGQTSLSVPRNVSLLSYARFLTQSKATRPTLRNYTVREFRPASDDGTVGPELDIDFVTHGDVGIAGPWASSCQPGDLVGILDEGIMYSVAADAERILLVSDETGLPAIAGICGSLPEDATARVIIEIPDAADAQEFERPAGVEVTWLVRDHPDTKPGALALDTVHRIESGEAPFHGFVVGESGLATGVRRHLVGTHNLPKTSVTFCGYWRAGH